ncbi:MAG TPA: glycosyltransferase, partial [Pseudonocardiaceae bacterium]|nr:glycosyltransferase [Pseudonocardiaceae bacterium]
TVIPNGVDADRFAAAVPSARFGEYVLAVGGIEPRKGSLDLLAAYALLLGRRPAARLVIAGGETLFDYRDYRARWDALAASLRVEPLVLGPVPHDELPGLVAGAAVFAFPSTKEGFGLAAMEALAAGVPVVTRDLPVLREVFGSAVRYATEPTDFADAMCTGMTVDDPAARAAGLDLARRHTWAAAAERHLDLYQRLTAGTAC